VSRAEARRLAAESDSLRKEKSHSTNEMQKTTTKNTASVTHGSSSRRDHDSGNSTNKKRCQHIISEIMQESITRKDHRHTYIIIASPICSPISVSISIARVTFVFMILFLLVIITIVLLFLFVVVVIEITLRAFRRAVAARRNMVEAALGPEIECEKPW